MTIEQFKVAASKGQGRAIQALRDGEVAPPFQVLRRFVLRWPGYDSQCESLRGLYTAELLSFSSYADELTEILIRHLDRTSGIGLNRSHRESVVGGLAKRGVESAREAIYRRFDPANDFRFADQILAVDGLAGLEWLISNSVDFLLPREAPRFWCWMLHLRRSVGDIVVRDWLAERPATDPNIGQFANLVATIESGPRGRKSKPSVAVPFGEFSQQWHQRTSPRPSALMWAQSATLEELVKAWRNFEVEQDPHWLRTLAIGLRRKVVHADIDTLVVRARQWKDAYNPFVTVLEEITDPRVRTLGFELIADDRIVHGIALVSKNAAVADVPLVLKAIEKLDEPADLHAVGVDLLRLANEQGFAPIFEWIAEMTPCSLCRNSAVRDLIEIDAASDALLRECLMDSDEDTREMAAKASGSRH